MAAALLELAERPPTPAFGRLAAALLQEAGDVLFCTAATRARAMVDLCRAGRSPEVAAALGDRLEGAAASLAPLLGRPEEAGRLLSELLDLALEHARSLRAGEAGEAAEEPRAARQLTRLWRDLFARLLRDASRGAAAAAAWSVMLRF